MAGFDFEFTYTDPQAAIVRVCLEAARSRARLMRLRWHFRTLGPRHLLVTVDGNSRRMDLLGYRLERDLPLVAEGCDSAAMSRGQRQKLGRGLVDLMLRGRHVDQDGPMALREAARTRWHYPPYDFDCPGHPLLGGRLSTTVEVLVAWNFGELAPEVVLEELHTACELVLEDAVNLRSKRMSFAELVSAADGGGLFAPAMHPAPAVELLRSLKDLRKDVRHRAAAGAEDWLNEHCEDVAEVLEHLVAWLNRSSSPSTPHEGSGT